MNKAAHTQAQRLDATLLSELEWFKGVPLSTLQAIAEGSKVESVPKGHIFFKAGERGKCLYLLQKGAVQTFRTSGKKTLIIADLKPPALFGEMGCVGLCLYHCAARAVEPSRVLPIPQLTVQALLEQHPAVARRLLDLVSQRFVDVLLDLDATSFRRLMPRLASLLLGKADGDFIHNLTHKEMAQNLRVYRESATAALGELKKAGIIEVKRKQIRILDRARLERAARE